MTPNTREIFEGYLLTNNVDYKLKGQILRPEVFDYEKKLGKSVFEMTPEELLEMLKTFTTGRKNKGHKLSVITLSQIAKDYRKVWNYYYEKYGIDKSNPWDKPMFSRSEMGKLFRDSKISWEIIQKRIELFRKRVVSPSLPNYVECLCTLLYCGFKNLDEIISLKEEQINFNTGEVTLSDRIVTVSPRGIELLKEIHDHPDYDACEKKYTYMHYNGSYLKFRTFHSKIDNLDLKNLKNNLSKYLDNIRDDSGIALSLQIIYLLGFYDYVGRQVGKERRDKLFQSIREEDCLTEIKELSRLYGIKLDPSALRYRFNMFE